MAAHRSVAGRGFDVATGDIACFAMSLGADQLLPQRGATVLLEDGTKLFGTFFWFGYHLRLSVQSIAGTLAGREPARAR